MPIHFHNLHRTTFQHTDSPSPKKTYRPLYRLGKCLLSFMPWVTLFCHYKKTQISKKDNNKQLKIARNEWADSQNSIPLTNWSLYVPRSLAQRVSDDAYKLWQNMCRNRTLLPIPFPPSIWRKTLGRVKKNLIQALREGCQAALWGEILSNLTHVTSLFHKMDL